MKEIYNAGSMFNEAQVNQRKIEGINLREAFPQMQISNPIDFPTNSGKTPTPLQIWAADYQHVKDSVYLIFEFDSFDHGVIMEFALAIEMAKATQANKFLVVVISDFRYHQKSSTHQLSAYSINHFMYGAIYDTQLNDEKRIYLAKSHQDAITMIKNQEEFLKTKDSKFINFNDELDYKFIYHDGEMFLKEN